MNPDTSADWTIAFATIGLALVTLLLAVVAAFQDKIRAWITQPRLEVTVVNGPPNCHKIPLSGFGARTMLGARPVTAESYYFRIRVKNSGANRAEHVEVYAAELMKRQADGAFKKVDSFLPMNLLWAHVNESFLPAISPGMEKLCNLGHVIKPSERSQFAGEDNPALGVTDERVVFSFDLEVKPNTLSHLIAPGVYQVRLLVAAANAEPVEKTMEINLTGDWHDDESKMLGEGVGLKMV